ncbi:prepilin peptidase, partial [Candidatus Omnitrophota bacterium]
GLIFSVFIPGLHNVSTWKMGFINSILGALIGGGTIYLMGFLGKIVFKKEAMGGGDVKLMAMLGAFLGWKMALLIFFLAPFFGTPAGIYLKFGKKCDIIPYGPYIATATFVVMIWGHRILDILFCM